jgi:hypothetical protein
MSKRWLPACGVAVLLAVSLLTGCAGTSPDLRGSWILISDGEHRFPAGATPGPGDIVKLVTDDAFATTGRRYVIDEVWRRLGRQPCGTAQPDAATP